ncbi:MAG TPA: YraN family protein [Candidatus Tumulicola sp.]|jgi:putative endonuclease
MEPSSRTQKGRDGEDAAVQFLATSGYRVLERNVRVPGGEIDAVCMDGATLVIVEVRRRDGKTFGSAIASVDARKRRTLRRSAEDYAQIVAPGRALRFDVVAFDGGRLRLFRNAF